MKTYPGVEVESDDHLQPVYFSRYVIFIMTVITDLYGRSLVVENSVLL